MKDNRRINVSVINSHYNRIFTYVASRVQNKQDLEDLCQEIFYIAIKNINSLKDMKKIVPWLFGISGNVIKRYYHQKQKRKTSEFIESSYIDKSEDITDIRLILEKIPDTYKVLYELYYVKNWKIKEIAQFKSMPEGTVKYYLFDLRKRMKKEIEEMSGGEEAS